MRRKAEPGWRPKPSRHACALSVAAALSFACASPVDSAPLLATFVEDAPGHTGMGFRDSELAVNGVRGAGELSGSFDVFTIGLRAGRDDTLVLAFEGERITDGPGADLVVFENAFRYAGGVFMEHAIVSVSRDGERWVDFPHAYLGADPARYSPDPADWRGFAGVHPVHLHEEHNPVPPFDHDAAGGDPFDLADLPADDPEAEAIREHGLRYVRLRTAATAENPATGERYPRDPVADGPDIDGVYGRYRIPDAP